VSEKTTRKGQRWGQADARLRYLSAVSRCVPEAIDELLTVDLDDDTAVHAWATRWGFVDGWARETALTHARLWKATPEWKGRWLIVHGNVRNMLPMDKPIWDPAFESEAGFRRRVEEYIRQVKETALPDVRSGDLHFEWLALAQVGGFPQVDIANRLNGSVSESAISQAIGKVAELVGVTRSS
jgi:hypothetical protein